MASNEGLIRWESLKSEECVKFEFNWTIENFLEAMKDPDCIDSPDFAGPTIFEEAPACSVTAYVGPEGENGEDYLCEYFSLGLYEPHEAYNEYEVSIMGADGQKLNTKTFQLAEFESRNNAEPLIPLEEIEKRKDVYLPNGNLTLHYEGKAWISLESKEELDDLNSQSEEEVMIRELSPENAWDYAVFARDHGATKLYKKAIGLLYKCV